MAKIRTIRHRLREMLTQTINIKMLVMSVRRGIQLSRIVNHGWHSKANLATMATQMAEKAEKWNIEGQSTCKQPANDGTWNSKSSRVTKRIYHMKTSWSIDQLVNDTQMRKNVHKIHLHSTPVSPAHTETDNWSPPQARKISQKIQLTFDTKFRI